MTDDASSTAEAPPRLDPRKSVNIAVFGKRGYGKSKLAEWLFTGYPFDKAVMDTTGDVGTHEGWENLDGLPSRWPLDLSLERKPRTLRWVPDPSSPTYKDDMDRFVGMCFEHGRTSGHTMCWLEEVHEVAASNRTGPNMRRAERQGRHANLSLLTTDIRPITVDPLVLHQADVVYSFRLPNPDDRAVLAKSIGWDLKEPIEELDGRSLDEILAGLPKYHHVRYESEADELLLFGPLPIDRRPINERHE